VPSESPSGYYDWQDRQPSPRAQEHARLVRRIREIHEDSRGVIGALACTKIRDEVEIVSLNRVARLMTVENIQCMPAQVGRHVKPCRDRFVTGGSSMVASVRASKEPRHTA